jgi:hypothetical protein
MKLRSVRPFIGATHFDTSRQFYRDLGFQESLVAPNLSYFHVEEFGFYLQDAYVKDWVDNTMVFMEVYQLDRHWEEMHALNLPAHYPGVRLSSIKSFDWGRECYLHDPSGILWHIGELKNQ